MELWIIFGACFLLQCFTTPLFLKYSWPSRTVKSHILKMICAALFVAVGFLSIKISGNTSDFAVTMLVGLILGFVGDFFLHFDNQSYFAIGFISFMAGHIAYIKAYVCALNLYEGYNQFNAYEIVAGIVICVFALWQAKRFKVSFSMKILKYGIILYSIILVTMFLKAVALGVNFLISGGENGVLALLVLSIGSLLFVMSDATLGILLFGGQKKNRPLKIFNIGTYFAGQMLLASSVLFIK